MSVSVSGTLLLSSVALGGGGDEKEYSEPYLSLQKRVENLRKLFLDTKGRKNDFEQQGVLKREVIGIVELMDRIREQAEEEGEEVAWQSKNGEMAYLDDVALDLLESLYDEPLMKELLPRLTREEALRQEKRGVRRSLSRQFRWIRRSVQREAQPDLLYLAANQAIEEGRSAEAIRFLELARRILFQLYPVQSANSVFQLTPREINTVAQVLGLLATQYAFGALEGDFERVYDELTGLRYFALERYSPQEIRRQLYFLSSDHLERLNTLFLENRQESQGDRAWILSQSNYPKDKRGWFQKHEIEVLEPIYSQPFVENDQVIFFTMGWIEEKVGTLFVHRVHLKSRKHVYRSLGEVPLAVMLEEPIWVKKPTGLSASLIWARIEFDERGRVRTAHLPSAEELKYKDYVKIQRINWSAFVKYVDQIPLSDAFVEQFEGLPPQEKATILGEIHRHAYDQKMLEVVSRFFGPEYDPYFILLPSEQLKELYFSGMEAGRLSSNVYRKKSLYLSIEDLIYLLKKTVERGEVLSSMHALQISQELSQLLGPSDWIPLLPTLLEASKLNKEFYKIIARIPGSFEIIRKAYLEDPYLPLDALLEYEDGAKVMDLVKVLFKDDRVNKFNLMELICSLDVSLDDRIPFLLEKFKEDIPAKFLGFVLKWIPYGKYEAEIFQNLVQKVREGQVEYLAVLSLRFPERSQILVPEIVNQLKERERFDEGLEFLLDVGFPLGELKQFSSDTLEGIYGYSFNLAKVIARSPDRSDEIIEAAISHRKRRGYLRDDFVEEIREIQDDILEYREEGEFRQEIASLINILDSYPANKVDTKMLRTYLRLGYYVSPRLIIRHKKVAKEVLPELRRKANSDREDKRLLQSLIRVIEDSP